MPAPGVKTDGEASRRAALARIRAGLGRATSGRAYLDRTVQEPVRQAVRELVRRHGVTDRRTWRVEPPAVEQLAFPLAPGEPVTAGG